jgi:ferric-dicitrate binding protein FerR (iron transport regulator)
MPNSGFEQRIMAWLDGRINEAESEKLQQELRDSEEARTAFRLYTELDAVIRETADTQGVGTISNTVRSAPSSDKPKTSIYLKVALSIAALVIFALTATLWIQQANRSRKIAHVTGLNGTLTWIGDGGELVQASDTLQVPTSWVNVLSEDGELSGGTIEGTAADSWFELKFYDRSTIMIFGKSNLTFSDHGQKILHLKQGRFSASVVPQPPSKPLVIHTPVATLTVIGTQFDLEAGPKSTMLYVRQGKVQISRRSDGKTVGVPAGHRVVISSGSNMRPWRISPDRSWGQTPFWQDVSSIDNNPDSIATQENHYFDGTRNLLLSEGPARIPAQNTNYIIASGDTFEVDYVWLGGMWWGGEDKVVVKLFTTDDDLISGSPDIFATMSSGPTPLDGTYQTSWGRATVAAKQVGKRLFVMIDTENGGGELHGIAYLDNFQLQVSHFHEPGTPSLTDFQLQGTTFPHAPKLPKPVILIGGQIRNGDFNGSDSD